jgi:hypothetical protein
LAIEFAIEMGMYEERYDDNNNNKFESVIELYEAGCADCVFNFVMDIESNKREERLVTPILMDFDDDKYHDRVLRRKVLGIHVFGDEKISLWKRWGDSYDRLMDMNGNQSSNITMEVTPFSNSLAII